MPAVEEPGRPHPRPEDNAAHGRLATGRGSPDTRPGPVGVRAVRGPGGEDLAIVLVPGPAVGGPYRVAVLLHGAGATPRQGLGLLAPLAGRERILLVAPNSTASSWDVVAGGFGPDVRRIDRVLTEVLPAYPVGGLAIGGFSDGASYALSLGLTNGDLFDAVLAFSPGFAAPLVSHGRPWIYVSHGTADRVLPIGVCSRRLVPRLRRQGYDVTYDEFEGGHEVPDDIVRRAVARWAPRG